jgi:hypothetical protein
LSSKKGKVRKEKQGVEREGVVAFGVLAHTLPYLPRQLTRVIKRDENG